MDSDTTAAWVERVRNGERQAFAELVARHERLVYGLAFRKLQDRGLAEDAAQESFIRAYRTLVRLKDPCRFASWLCGIAVNVAREMARRRGRREVSLEAAGEPAAPGPDAGDAEQAERVMALAETLPEKYRLPLQMHYMGGLRHAEIGEALGVPEATARSLVFRARLMLAEWFLQRRD